MVRTAPGDEPLCKLSGPTPSISFEIEDGKLSLDAMRPGYNDELGSRLFRFTNDRSRLPKSLTYFSYSLPADGCLLNAPLINSV